MEESQGRRGGTIQDIFKRKEIGTRSSSRHRNGAREKCKKAISLFVQCITIIKDYHCRLLDQLAAWRSTTWYPFPPNASAAAKASLEAAAAGRPLQFWKRRHAPSREAMQLSHLAPQA